LGDQAGQAGLGEGSLGLVERRTGKAEGGAGLAHGLALLSDPPQHFVLHLHQVLSIEKGVVAVEGGVGDLVRAGVEGVVAA
jgi:hypothetical protein